MVPNRSHLQSGWRNYQVRVAYMSDASRSLATEQSGGSSLRHQHRAQLFGVFAELVGVGAPHKT